MEFCGRKIILLNPLLQFLKIIATFFESSGKSEDRITSGSINCLFCNYLKGK